MIQQLLVNTHKFLLLYVNVNNNIAEWRREGLAE